MRTIASAIFFVLIAAASIGCQRIAPDPAESMIPAFRPVPQAMVGLPGGTPEDPAVTEYRKRAKEWESAKLLAEGDAQLRDGNLGMAFVCYDEVTWRWTYEDRNKTPYSVGRKALDGMNGILDRFPGFPHHFHIKWRDNKPIWPDRL